MQKIITERVKTRREVLIIAPKSSIKENLYAKVFKQIIDSVQKFKCYEMEKVNKYQFPSTGKVYLLILNERKNKNKVLEIIEKFNFEIIS